MTGELQAALAGAVVGAVVGYFGVVVHDWRRDGRERKRVAIALYAEMVSLIGRYNRVFGTAIQNWQPGQPLPVSGDPLVRSQEFFTVYEGNTSKLGLFNHKDVLTLVNAYALAKSHVETLNQSAERVKAYTMATAVQQRSGGLDEIGKILKAESSEMGQAWQAAIEAMRKYAGIKK